MFPFNDNSKCRLDVVLAPHDKVRWISIHEVGSSSSVSEWTVCTTLSHSQAAVREVCRACRHCARAVHNSFRLWLLDPDPWLPPVGQDEALRSDLWLGRDTRDESPGPCLGSLGGLSCRLRKIRDATVDPVVVDWALDALNIFLPSLPSKSGLVSMGQQMIHQTVQLQ
jgi:hypothetical protein